MLIRHKLYSHNYNVPSLNAEVCIGQTPSLLPNLDDSLPSLHTSHNGRLLSIVRTEFYALQQVVVSCEEVTGSRVHSSPTADLTMGRSSIIHRQIIHMRWVEMHEHRFDNFDYRLLWCYFVDNRYFTPVHKEYFDVISNLCPNYIYLSKWYLNQLHMQWPMSTDNYISLLSYSETAKGITNTVVFHIIGTDAQSSTGSFNQKPAKTASDFDHD